MRSTVQLVLWHLSSMHACMNGWQCLQHMPQVPRHLEHMEQYVVW